MKGRPPPRPSVPAPTPDAIVHATAQAASDKLDDILALFKPGARIALAVWYPGKPEVDFVLISPEASLGEAIDTLKRRCDASTSIYGRTKT